MTSSEEAEFMPSSDTLALFCHAHAGALEERERCLGVVEKALLQRPSDPILISCKAALLLLVARQSQPKEAFDRFRRVSTKLAQQAMTSAHPKDLPEMRFVNGLAWAQMTDSAEGDDMALWHLEALTECGDVAQLGPVEQVDVWVALSVVYEARSRHKDSKETFLKAAQLDRATAIAAFERIRNARLLT